MFGQMFKIKVVSAEEVFEMYRMALQELPAVLLVKGVSDVLSKMTIHTMPLPGEIVATVEEEFSAMKRHYDNLQFALRQHKRTTEASGKRAGSGEKRNQNYHWNSKLDALEAELGEEAVCKGLRDLIVDRDEYGKIKLWAKDADQRDYFEIDRGAEIAAVLGREKVTVAINPAAVGAARKRQAETALQRSDQPDLLPGEASALLEDARPELVARLGEDEVVRWFDPLAWDLSGGPMIELYAPIKFGADRARGALGAELEMLTGRRVKFRVGLPPAQGNGSQTGMDLQARHAEGSR